MPRKEEEKELNRRRSESRAKLACAMQSDKEEKELKKYQKIKAGQFGRYGDTAGYGRSG